MAINGDFIAVLNKLIVQLTSSSDIQKQRQLQRAAARKAIRSTNISRDEQDQGWPDTLQQYCLKVKSQYPCVAEDINYLYEVATNPQGDIFEFVSRLTTFANWLD